MLLGSTLIFAWHTLHLAGSDPQEEIRLLRMGLE
jgi:hypothetical protein